MEKDAKKHVKFVIKKMHDFLVFEYTTPDFAQTQQNFARSNNSMNMTFRSSVGRSSEKEGLAAFTEGWQGQKNSYSSQVKLIVEVLTGNVLVLLYKMWQGQGLQ